MRNGEALASSGVVRNRETWQEHAGLREYREAPWNGAWFFHLELMVVRAAHGIGNGCTAHRSCWEVHAGGLYHSYGMRYVFRVSSLEQAGISKWR